MIGTLTRIFQSRAYLNGVLTLIALLLTAHLVINFDVPGPRAAQAGEVVPVRIEGVRGNVPVAIKDPISMYPHSVCVTRCK